ncbi:hypothetical protein O4J56_12185 [Nocardiopsis sp. RSe5-2]|uniref:Uncharacterized protein n=1 Tax=Nocardiopsis endophytica TaxID=3018445 RepID=A0ABT4U4X6_9ACTN|nr:hypothetical protein [Nocardiopsis endophytica]MDA2811392.1 hypothetical protein [Nocardiopsis endophytica]
MTLTWPMKPLGAMTAAELLAALEQLDAVAPDDEALGAAVRAELMRAMDTERTGHVQRNERTGRPGRTEHAVGPRA